MNLLVVRVRQIVCNEKVCANFRVAIAYFALVKPKCFSII